MILTGLILLGVVLFPMFLLRSNGVFSIPQKYIEVTAGVYFGYLLYMIFKGERDSRGFSRDYEPLIRMVPSQVKKIFRMYMREKAVKRGLYFGIIYVMMAVFNRTSIVNFFLGLILVVGITMIHGNIQGCVFLISFRKNKIVRALALIIAIICLVQGGGALFGFDEIGAHWNPLIVAFTILVQGAVEILNGTDFKNIQLFYLLLFGSYIFVKVLYILILRRTKIYPQSICEVHQKDGALGTAPFIRVMEKMLFFLPKKLKIIVLKELVHIWHEKTPLATAIMMPLFAMGIMLFVAKSVDSGVFVMGYIIVVSYLSFLVSLVSIPREMRSIWILKTTGVKASNVIFGKFIGVMIVSVVLSVFMIFMYGILGYFVVGISFKNLIGPFLWTIIGALPLSIAFGGLIGSLVPFDIVEKNKEIDYKFGGIESGMLFILVFLVALPSTLAGGYFGDLQNIYLVGGYFAYSVLGCILAYKVSKKKIYECR